MFLAELDIETLVKKWQKAGNDLEPLVVQLATLENEEDPLDQVLSAKQLEYIALRQKLDYAKEKGGIILKQWTVTMILLLWDVRKRAQEIVKECRGEA